VSPNYDVVPAYRLAMAINAERASERADVVAFLRKWQNTMDDRITHDDLDYAIAVIERGEHRRTGGDK